MSHRDKKGGQNQGLASIPEFAMRQVSRHLELGSRHKKLHRDRKSAGPGEQISLQNMKFRRFETRPRSVPGLYSLS